MHWLIRGAAIDEFCGSRFISLSSTIVFPAISGLNPREDDAKLEMRIDFTSRKSHKNLPRNSTNHEEFVAKKQIKQDKR